VIAAVVVVAEEAMTQVVEVQAVGIIGELVTIMTLIGIAIIIMVGIIHGGLQVVEVQVEVYSLMKLYQTRMF
jgi:hypothetical protein